MFDWSGSIRPGDDSRCFGKRPIKGDAGNSEERGRGFATLSFVDQLPCVLDLLAVSFFFGPLLTPRALAAFIPSRVRSIINPRSNSASAAKI
jgi:hypothetical protein